VTNALDGCLATLVAGIVALTAVILDKHPVDVDELGSVSEHRICGASSGLAVGVVALSPSASSPVPLVVTHVLNLNV
jgi:hypothetical protein